MLYIFTQPRTRCVCITSQFPTYVFLYIYAYSNKDKYPQISSLIYFALCWKKCYITCFFIQNILNFFIAIIIANYEWWIHTWNIFLWTSLVILCLHIWRNMYMIIFWDIDICGWIATYTGLSIFLTDTFSFSHWLK